MGTFDDFFSANGTASPGFNYMAFGTGRVGFSTPADIDNFDVGGGFNGKSWGVLGHTGRAGPSLWPPQTSYANAAGVIGAAPFATGVAGLSTFGAGVYGQVTLPQEDVKSIPLGLFAGIVGVSVSRSGVFGWSTSGHGVWGTSSGGEAGVLGLAHQGRGVLGLAETGTLSGVEGRSGDAGPPPGMGIPDAAGVYGTAAARPGVIGTSNNLMGVYGFSAGNAGIVGQTGNPKSFAGYFAGNLVVTGTKSAAVPFPDGSQRALYCMESPELWFEDFGTAKLRRGRAVVEFDADFAKVIKRGDYRVFFTPEGDCRGLYVRRKTAASFEVRESQGGKSSIAFSYRIIGRRKDVAQQRRFAKVTPPVLPGAPPRKPAPTAAGLRAFVTRVEREARRSRPKVAKKSRRSRALPKYLRRHIVARPRRPAPPRPQAKTQ
jgi:hypothetical protein